MTLYKNLKTELKQVSKQAKTEFENDKPAIRQAINNYCDHLVKSNDLSEYKINLLHSYAASLHP